MSARCSTVCSTTSRRCKRKGHQSCWQHASLRGTYVRRQNEEKTEAKEQKEEKEEKEEKGETTEEKEKEEEEEKTSVFRKSCEAKFHIEAKKKLGEGSSGKVYEACFEDEETECKYAVKIQYVADPSQIRNETRVARLMGIYDIGPRVYDAWYCKDYFYLAMDKLHGMTWPDFWRSHKAAARVEAIRDLKAKVQQMHELGYTHGDIRGPNVIVLDDNKSVRLLDFGFSAPLTLVPTKDKTALNVDRRGLLELLSL